MLHQKSVKHTHTKKQKAYRLFALIVPAILLLCQSPVYSEQYVIVESENGDRLTGTWIGGTDTHFEIEYNGQVLQLPVAGYTLKFTSNLANVPDGTATKYYNRGIDLLEMGLPELAQRRFEEAIEEYPKYPAAHYQLGLLYKANGDTANALERFRSTALLDAPSFDLVPLFHEFGDIALANEDYAVAVDSYQLILIYYPEHTDVPMLSYLTGFLLVEQLEDQNAGLLLLESAIKEYPDMAGHEKALFLIGKLQAETGELENALHTLEGFVTRYPGSEWIYDAHLIRAAAYLKLGRLEEAASEAILVDEISNDEKIEERAKEILDQTKWTVYTDADGLPDNHIQAITTDGTRLWIGTPKGVMVFETVHGKWIPIEGQAQLINTALENVPDVRAIAANEQEVWVGTRFQGVVHYSKLTGKIEVYFLSEGLPAWVKDIKMDEMEVWFATDVGIIRKIRGSDGPPLHYNTVNSDLPADDIETLLLTPKTCWATSADGVIGIFDREIEGWDSYHSTALREGMTIVGLDTAEEQLLFTWFNADEKSNGFFRADMDGGNGKSTTLDTGIEDENDLRNIYIRGALDTSPIVQKGPEEIPVEETPDPTISEFSSEIAGLEIEPPPPKPPIPLVLWITTNDDFYTYHTRSKEWEYVTMPQITMGELTTKALVVINNRIWIATSNGLVSTIIQ